MKSHCISFFVSNVKKVVAKSLCYGIFGGCPTYCLLQVLHVMQFIKLELLQVMLYMQEYLMDVVVHLKVYRSKGQNRHLE